MTITQISYEAYQSMKKYEVETGRPLNQNLLLQVGKLNDKWCVFHVKKVYIDEHNRHLMDSETKAEFNTQAEAKMYIRSLKNLFNQKFGVKFDSSGSAFR